MSPNSGKPPRTADAGAIGGKTARACDSCMLRRARWYCAADDAFLCHPCDSSVHSANPLARRHDRLRLKCSTTATPSAVTAPKWHNGFKRKARTPRHRRVVPELESSADEVGDDEVEEEEEELLYRVPVFDPALAFDVPSPTPTIAQASQAAAVGVGVEFAPTELELAEFAADMENLLGRGFDSGESFCMEELGLLDESESGDGREVHVKGEVDEVLKGEGLSFEMEVDLSRETLDLDFGCGSPEMTEASVAKAEEETTTGMGLRLNYEAVMDAWLVKGSSPWISDERPLVGAQEYWIEVMGMWGGVGRETARGIQMINVGREARVTRYREKRRTRLFSKKIRYEVRKLNAEKRPRMKGRFVKRSSFPATAAASGRGGYGGGSVAVAAC